MRLLLDRIGDGRCVPVLGAAANVSGGGYEGLPLAAEVAGRLAEEMGFHASDIADLDPELDLAKVALEFEHKVGRRELIEFLQTIIPDREREPSPLLRTLARLPLKLIITTNYDRLMERALDDAGKAYKVIVQPTRGWRSWDRARVTEELAKYEGLILYKLHGSFSGSIRDDVEPPDLVVTEDDYIDFMGALSMDTGVPSLIRAQLVDSTLLFLGYSLKDWDFRLLLRSLSHAERRVAFMLLKAHPSRFWVEYLRRKGILIYDVDVYEFAEDLGRRWDEYAERRRASPPRAPPRRN